MAICFLYERNERVNDFIPLGLNESAFTDNIYWHFGINRNLEEGIYKYLCF